MTIDEKVPRRCVFVLANAGLHDRRVFQGRESPCHKTPSPLRAFSRDEPGLPIGIYPFTVSIAGKFQSARLDVRHAVGIFLLEQTAWQRGRGKSRVTRRCAKEENFLPGRENSRPQQLRKDLAEPWPTGEDELSR